MLAVGVYTWHVSHSAGHSASSPTTDDALSNWCQLRSCSGTWNDTDARLVHSTGAMPVHNDDWLRGHDDEVVLVVTVDVVVHDVNLS